MNHLEQRIVRLLHELRNEHHAIGVKAEFEAEGTRFDEARRLQDLAGAAGLELSLKIGGCEAVRDLYEARTLGVRGIIAPMIESAFALTKFIAAVNCMFSVAELQRIDLGINIETITGVKVFAEIRDLKEFAALNAVTVGRKDLAGSLGLASDTVDGEQIFALTERVLIAVCDRPVTKTVGGGLTADSLEFLRRLGASVNRFETRKVMFDCEGALSNEPSTAILKALQFELLWLEYRMDKYGPICVHDDARRAALQERVLRTERGGASVAHGGILET